MSRSLEKYRILRRQRDKWRSRVSKKHHNGLSSNEYRRLKRYKEIAFHIQDGWCFWCGCLMILSPRWANHWRNCSGDHLVPTSEGGTTTLLNIVAACRWCNSSRNSPKQGEQSCLGI